MVLTQNAENMIKTRRPLTTLCLAAPYTPTEYLNWHDRLGQYIHCCLCKNFCLPHERNRQAHKPPKVTENKNATILSDFDIHTDRTIQANCSDIVVQNHNDKTCYLIDISVPSDTNVSLKSLKN